MKYHQNEMSGWGNFPCVKASCGRPERRAQVLPLLKQAGKHIARGCGAAYGDGALAENILLTERLDRFLSFNPKNGVLTAEAGVTVQDVLQVVVPKGWILPAMPGTMKASLGGCVAADVHGRDHQRGSFGHHVKELVLRLADGGSVTCSLKENKDIFEASIGGMGLTGVVETVTVQLQRISSSWLNVTTTPVDDLDGMVDAFAGDALYTGAWLDVAGHQPVGRGWVQHANMAENMPLEGFNVPSSPIAEAGVKVCPSFMLNRLSMRVFNQLIHQKTAKGGSRQVPLGAQLFPLDKLAGWNRLYGQAGFGQFQCVVPGDVAKEVLMDMLKVVGRSQTGSYFATCKPFGSKEPVGLLSFPMKKGVTLALDIPMVQDARHTFAHLNDMALAVGGRVYLAKDATLTPKQFEGMYPQLEAFEKVKKAVDPKNKFSSALWERVRP